MKSIVIKFIRLVFSLLFFINATILASNLSTSEINKFGTLNSGSLPFKIKGLEIKKNDHLRWTSIEGKLIIISEVESAIFNYDVNNGKLLKKVVQGNYSDTCSCFGKNVNDISWYIRNGKNEMFLVQTTTWAGFLQKPDLGATCMIIYRYGIKTNELVEVFRDVILENNRYESNENCAYTFITGYNCKPGYTFKYYLHVEDINQDGFFDICAPMITDSAITKTEAKKTSSAYIRKWYLYFYLYEPSKKQFVKKKAGSTNEKWDKNYWKISNLKQQF